MKGYDSLLFRALIGANQLEFKENMDSAESAEYSYSPRYNRFRLQILADPFRWAKKRRRPMWQKIITNVACCKSDGPGSSIELASGYKRK